MTKKYDLASYFDIQELRDRITMDPNLKTDTTQCAHIFAESTNISIEPGSAKVHHLFLLSFVTLDDNYLYIA